MGFKSDIDNQLVSFSALTLLVKPLHYYYFHFKCLCHFAITGLESCDENDAVFLHCIVVSKISPHDESPGKPLSSLTCLDCW